LGKLTNSIALMSGILLLFYFGGLIPSTPTTALLNLALHPESLQGSVLWNTIIGVSSLVLGFTALVLGNFLNVDLYYFWPLVIYFLNVGYDFMAIYQQIAGYSAVAAVFSVLLFGPLMIIYVIGLVEWWRGVET